MGQLTTQKHHERTRIIRDMTEEQAQQELADLRLNLFHLRMQAARGEVKNFRQFAQTRKDIAAILHKLHMARLERLAEAVETEDEDLPTLAGNTPEPAGDEEEAE